MGARADGWWRDRAGAAARLCGEVAALARRGLAASELPPDAAQPAAPAPPDATQPAQGQVVPDWVLVLEGRARQAADSLSVEAGSSKSALFLADSDRLARLLLAPGSGDDAIVDALHGLHGLTIVVTADRELRWRCQQAGAVTVGPGWLLRLL